jgi:hypothetical protein
MKKADGYILETVRAVAMALEAMSKYCSTVFGYD